MNKKVVEWLEKLNACEDAVVWVKEQQTPAQAWRDCKRGDWMLWLLGKLAGEPGSVRRKKLVLAAYGCARLALKYIPKGEDRPRIAIETAERWAHGKATIDEVRIAADGVYAAAYAAAYDAASYAAAYAASAAYADAAADADAAAYADAASYAYAAAADAAAAYAYADAAYARKKTLAKCADIVRKHYPKPPRIKEKS